MLKPVDGRVVIEQVEAEEKTESGIFIPEEVQDKEKRDSRRAKVIALGDEQVTEEGLTLPHLCQVGDDIYYGKYAGHPIKYEGKDYIVIERTDVLAIIKD